MEKFMKKSIQFVIAFLFTITSFQTFAIGELAAKVATVSNNTVAETGLANPDHRRVAGSAVILKTNGTIDDSTIPSIEQPTDLIKENSIFDFMKPADIKLEETRIIQ